MWEMLYIAAGLRLPIVAGIANRALSAPINIHGDHSDTMGARDSGWIQIYSENCQEAYDNFIQAFRIAEHMDVRTPVFVGLDGFIVSHSVEVIQVEDDDAVKKFIGEYVPVFPLLDTSRKLTVGPIDFTDYYFEHKRSQIEGIENSPKVIEAVAKEFGRTFGREYGFFEEYKLDDAEIAIVVMSSAAGTCKDASRRSPEGRVEDRTSQAQDLPAVPQSENRRGPEEAQSGRGPRPVLCARRLRSTSFHRDPLGPL